MTTMPASRPLSIATLLLGVTLIAGCAQFPELDRTITPELEAAPYPDIVPIDPLLAQATAGRIDPVRTEAELSGRAAQLEARAGRVASNSPDTATAARVARLRAKAERLRQQRLTPEERERLEQTPSL